MITKKKIISIPICALLLLVVSSCETIVAMTSKTENEKTLPIMAQNPAKTLEAYQSAGQWWGKRHWESGLKAGEHDELFIDALITEGELGFFWVHSDLKEAFKRGYRFGYQARIADLVLGPNLSEAAGLIGKNTSEEFVKVINEFEKGWARSLNRAISAFIALITEGSQADRERFIHQFAEVYSAKYKKTRKVLDGGGLMTVTSQGGTLLWVDARNTLAVLDIPHPEVIKMEIYHQAFQVMGDEWGRRLSHNLIKRDELIEMFRRSKVAFTEVPKSLQSNLGIVWNSFQSAYGTDAKNVLLDILVSAGYKTKDGERPKFIIPKKK